MIERTAPPPEDPIEAGDGELTRGVDAAMGEAVRRAGPLFGCGPGRTDCCRGPFPVNLLDARRLQRGLLALESGAAPRAGAVRRRAAEAVARLSASFPGDAATGLLGGDEAAEEAFCSAHAEEPCPALDPASGRCDVYEWRPLACPSPSRGGPTPWATARPAAAAPGAGRRPAPPRRFGAGGSQRAVPPAKAAPPGACLRRHSSTDEPLVGTAGPR